MKNKILISSANGVVMKSLITELKKYFYIIGIDAEKYGDAKNYCDEFYICPNGNSKNFISFLKKVSKKVDFVFLYVDEEILNINKNRKKLSNIIHKIIISESKTVDVCLNKKKFFNFFKGTEINIPESKYSKLMIAKPILGRGGNGILRINNKKDYNHFKNKKDYIVQKYINGREFTVDCLFDENGELIFNLCRERIVERGVSIVGKIIYDQKLDICIKQISEKLNFFGPINIQLIKDIKKKIWLIEINPRLSGSIEFSIKAGFNLFLYYTRAKTNKFKVVYNQLFKRSFQISK